MPIAPDKNQQSPPTPAGENIPPKKFSAILPIIILILVIIPVIFFLFKNASKPNNQQTHNPTPTPLQRAEQLKTVGTVTEVNAKDKIFKYKDASANKIYTVSVDSKTVIVKGQEKTPASFEMISVGSLLTLSGEKSSPGGVSIKALTIVIQDPQKFLPRVD